MPTLEPDPRPRAGNLVEATDNTSTNLREELLRIEPSAVPVGIDGVECLRFQTAVPRFVFESLVCFPSPVAALMVKARSSYDEALAAALLRAGRAVFDTAFRSRTITVVAGPLHPASRFDALVFAPPAVAQCFVGRSPALEGGCAWVIPAFENEFRTGQDRQDFISQYARKDEGRVDIADWNRCRKMPASR